MNAPQEIFTEGLVAPEHAELEERLQAWGRWSRERRRKLACRSVEHKFQSTGWRSYNAPDESDFPIALPPDPKNIAVDRAVLEVPHPHQLALKLHYVQLAPVWLVARRCNFPAYDFGRWMYDARCMVAHRLGA